MNETMCCLYVSLKCCKTYGQEKWMGGFAIKVSPYKIFTWDLEHLKPGEKLDNLNLNLKVRFVTCMFKRFPMVHCHVIAFIILYGLLNIM